MNRLFFLFLALFCHISLAQAPVVVSRVIEAESRSGQRVIGTVRPLRTTTIGSAVDGRVLRYDVNQGDAVKAGQELAQLRTETLQIQLAAANAELNLAKYQLEELENGSLPETIAESDARMQAAKALKENAAKTLKRLTALKESQAASRAELEQAEEQADAMHFTWMATVAMLQRVKDGPRKELIAQAAARVDLQQQQVKLLEDQIVKFTIVSPFDGFVATEFTEVGAWISQGDPIARVVQLDEVEIEVPVIAENAVELTAGDPVRVEFPELPEQLFVGTVDRIVPVADNRARTFPVFVRMKNPMKDGRPTVMAGMLARVELPAGRRQIMPLVPKDALVLNGTDRSVFIVRKLEGQIGVSAKVQVQLGVAVDHRIQVRGDVREGDLVVVVGNERLVPETKVKIIRTATDADSNGTSAPSTESDVRE